MRKRLTARRCRAAVLWCLAGFCAFQVGLSVVVERWKPEFRDPEYGAKRKLLAQQQALHPDRPLALLLGSSRVLDGLHPNLLPPCRTPVGSPLVFNFGLTGAGPVEQLLTLQRLLKDGHHPRWVVIEVLPSMLPRTASDALVHTERQSWSDVRLLRPYVPDPLSQARTWLDARVVPWFSHRFCLLSMYMPRWVPDANRVWDVWSTLDHDGWLPLRPSEELADARSNGLVIARQQHACYLQHFTISPVMDHALCDLLDLCRREKIAAALLVMPESTEFRSWYSAMGQQVLTGYLDHLSTTYRVPVIDARAWVADDNFCDGHHLLPEGAEEFTRRFGSEALAPFLAESPIPRERQTRLASR